MNVDVIRTMDQVLILIGYKNSVNLILIGYKNFVNLTLKRAKFLLHSSFSRLGNANVFVRLKGCDRILRTRMTMH